jgi:NADH-quinone oxidoreductase subunit L
LPLIVGVLGIFLAWVFYIRKPTWPAAWATNLSLLYQLIFHKYYFDELYDFLFVRRAFDLGRFFWKRGDVGTIDAFGPDGISSLTRSASAGFSRLQSGYLFHYALAMLVGVLILTTFYLVLGGV